MGMGVSMSSLSKVLFSGFLCLLVFGCAGKNSDVQRASVADAQAVATHYEESLIRKIYFDFDRSSVKDESKATLLELVKLMQESPEKTLLIVGHADERGTEEYNIALGERRANAAKQFIISCDSELKGRIKVDSKGKSEPEVIGHGEAVWSKNRRDVLVLSGADSDSEAVAEEAQVTEVTEVVAEEEA